MFDVGGGPVDFLRLTPPGEHGHCHGDLLDLTRAQGGQGVHRVQGSLRVPKYRADIEQTLASRLGELVANVTREVELTDVQPRACEVTTNHREGGDEPGYLRARKFTAREPGLRLVEDFTPTRDTQGRQDSAPIIDSATRMVVGRQITDHMSTSLIINPLDRGSNQRTTRSGGIVHADYGVQGIAVGLMDTGCVTYAAA